MLTATKSQQAIYVTVDISARLNSTEKSALADSDVSRIIEMAWEDRTPFEAIATLYGLNEAAVIRLMRRELKPGSFRRWRARVSGRVTKHAAKRPEGVLRAYCPTQYKVR